MTPDAATLPDTYVSPVGVAVTPADMALLLGTHVSAVGAAVVVKDLELVVKYDPNEPRVPAGNPTGGQWTSGSAPGVVEIEAELNKQANEGIKAVSSLLPEAVKTAVPVRQNWEDLTPQQRYIVFTEWKKENEERLRDEAASSLRANEELRLLRGKDDDAREAQQQSALAAVARVSEGRQVDATAVRWQINDHGEISVDIESIRPEHGTLPRPRHEIAYDIEEQYYQGIHDRAVQWLAANPESIKVEAARLTEARWLAYDDETKILLAATHGVVPESRRGGTPQQWDWAGSSNGDYSWQGSVARRLVELRTQELLRSRDLGNGFVEDFVADQVPAQLWGAWKDSSTSSLGKAMQIAAAEELPGGVHRFSDAEVKMARLYAGATLTSSADRRALLEAGASGDDVENMRGELGMQRLRAYVRAQWETTQYVLSSEGKDTVNVYRGLMLSNDDLGDPQEGAKLHDISLKRNGLQSATVLPSVANGWDGVGNLPDNPRRVVLRLQVPRTSVFSIPVFGDNHQGEREVVVAGTRARWKWDAYADAAPDIERTPIEKAYGQD